MVSIATNLAKKGLFISLWDGRKVSTKVDNADNDNASNSVIHETMNYFKFKQFIC